VTSVKLTGLVRVIHWSEIVVVPMEGGRNGGTEERRGERLMNDLPDEI